MCGILGVMQNHLAVQDLYDGLIVLQHRGQDAAGIATYDGGQLHLKKGRHPLGRSGDSCLSRVLHPRGSGWSRTDVVRVPPA